MVFDLSNLPRTTPHRTTVGCASGAHEGTHSFEGDYLDRACKACGKRARDPIHTPPRYLPCRGGTSWGDCQCLCHPSNRRYGHWHIVNVGTASSGRFQGRTLCLGHDGLREGIRAIRQMTPKSYLKRVEDIDDACLARTSPSRGKR